MDAFPISSLFLSSGVMSQTIAVIVRAVISSHR